MGTLHPFPRSHSKKPALEQQLLVLTYALIERYGPEITVDLLQSVSLDVCKAALAAAATR